jgi:hypothetical protein
MSDLSFDETLGYTIECRLARLAFAEFLLLCPRLRIKQLPVGMKQLAHDLPFPVAGTPLCLEDGFRNSRRVSSTAWRASSFPSQK